MFPTKSFIVLTLLGAAGAAVAVVAAPVGATAAGPEHTLHVTAKRAAEVQFKHGGFTEADKVRSKSGKLLGTDISDCTPVSATKAKCNGVVGLDGGVLSGRFSLDLATGAIKGTITGGTMAYRGATGSINGAGFNGGSHLTIRYALKSTG